MPVLWQMAGRNLGRGFHGECACKLSKMLWKLSKKAIGALVCLLLRFTRHNARPMTRLNTLSKRYATVSIFSYSVSIIEQEKRKKESTVALSSWISRAMRTRFKVLPVYFAFRGRGGGNLRNLAEVPLFVDSQASRIIQIADLVAWAVWRRYEFQDTRYFDRIVSRFDSEGGVLHGARSFWPQG